MINEIELYDDEAIGEEPSEIINEADANRALYFVRRARQRKQRAAELAAVEAVRIKSWLDQETEIAERAENFWIQSLNDYHAAMLTRDPKAKTLRFPEGTLKATVPTRPMVEYDADALLEWAKENRPEIVRTKYELDRNALKALEPDELGVFPTVELSPASPKFTVNTDVLGVEE